MKPALPIAAALLLAALGVGIVMSNRGNSAGPASSPREDSSTLPAKTSRQPVAKVSPEAAAKSLRSLPDLDLAQAPSFDEVESLCRHLSDADLHALITEVGFADPEGLTGWLRCALWAEITRRDHILAFDLLQRTQLAGADGESSIDAMDQITSSYFRARITGIDINDAVLAELFEEIYVLQQHKEGISGTLAGFGRIFGEWTKHDPATVWETIHRDNENGRIPEKLYDALKLKDQDYGYHELFLHLSDPADVRKYSSEWTATWNSPANTKSFENFTDHQRSRYSGIIMIPEAELLAATAAASLARSDPDAAIAWLHESGPQRKDGERDSTRDWNLRKSLVNHYPETARQWLVDPDRARYHPGLAAALIQNDPNSAPDVIALLNDPKSQATAIRMSISSMSNNRQVDYFPKPGRENRLPDFQGRFDALNEAINSSQVSTEQRTQLHKALLKEMGKRLPHLQ